MKTPISYYGGKQKLVKTILPLIPAHRIYIEPFFGGGAIFFAKEPSDVEVINDVNSNVINFFRMLYEHFDLLKAELDMTLFSREQYRRAAEIYSNPEKFDPVKRAWAFWVQSQMSFSHNLLAGWGITKCSRAPETMFNRKAAFTRAYAERLRRVFIEHNDALRVIELFDREDAFIYCDPPYVSSDQGHYAGYSIDDFRNLLECLKGVKGKFLLSSYPEALLMQYRTECNWLADDRQQLVAVTGKRKERKTKIECLTMNYQCKGVTLDFLQQLVE